MPICIDRYDVMVPIETIKPIVILVAFIIKNTRVQCIDRLTEI